MGSAGLAKTAVTLSGGGAYGAYEVGVLKSLVNGQSRAVNGVSLQPAILTGTSVGAFNAAVLTMLPGRAIEAVERLERIWLDDIADGGGAGGNGVYRIRGNPEGYLEGSTLKHPLAPLLRAAADVAFIGSRSVTQVTQFFTSGGSLANRALGLIDISALISVEPFDELLKKTIDPERIRSSPIVLCAVATDWRSGQPRVFHNSDFTDAEGRDAVKASASIPGIFPATTIGDRTYVDGGVVMNTPISYAVDAGANEVHLVYMNPAVRDVPLHKNEGTIDVFDRAIATMLAAAINQDIAMAESINKGLDTLNAANADTETAPSEGANWLRVAARIGDRLRQDRPYRSITIHRHYPRQEVAGALGLLNFSRVQIRDLIELGYRETCEHDCAMNQCIIPTPGERAPVAKGAQR
jgi:predicted acylesterase/phospholipase RssA